MLLYAAIGGIGALALTSVVVRARESARRYVVVVFLLSFVLCYGLADVMLSGEWREYARRANARRVIESTPSFRLITRDHPELMAEFVDFMLITQREGRSRDEAYQLGMRWGREHLAPYFVTYIPRASDASARAYGAAFTAILDTLRKADVRACSQWLFGLAPGDTPSSFRLPQRQEQALGRAVENVIRSAQTASVASVDSARGMALMENVLARIGREHGDSALDLVYMLDEPYLLQGEHRLACDATHLLYTTILQLPADDIGPLLRYMFVVTSP
jgi:hypothetical protein